jgi:hypothetical protein
VFSWFNLLLQKDLLSFEEEEVADEKTEETATEKENTEKK